MTKASTEGKDQPLSAGTGREPRQRRGMRAFQTSEGESGTRQVSLLLWDLGVGTD